MYVAEQFLLIQFNLYFKMLQNVVRMNKNRGKYQFVPLNFGVRIN